MYEQEFPIGDTNFDEKVSVTDYVNVASHIIPTDESGRFNQTQADVNADGVIDVADYVHVANIILHDNPNGSSAKHFAPAVGSWDDAMLSLSVDKTSAMTVAAMNAGTFSAFQFDVELPQGLSVTDAAKAFASSGHKLTCANMGGNSYRFLCGDINNSNLCNGGLVKMNLGFIDDFKDGNICISNIRLVEGNGRIHNINDVMTNYSAATGIEVVSAASGRIMDNAVYDLQGRKVADNRKDAEKLPTGVYIRNHQSFIVK